jgi:hypothetical protein
VDIQQQDASSFKLTQPFLIKRITKFPGIDNGTTNERLTPVGKPLLKKTWMVFHENMTGNIKAQWVCCHISLGVCC